VRRGFVVAHRRVDGHVRCNGLHLGWADDPEPRERGQSAESMQVPDGVVGPGMRHLRQMDQGDLVDEGAGELRSLRNRDVAETGE